jgi:hypothetical protein
MIYLGTSNSASNQAAFKAVVSYKFVIVEYFRWHFRAPFIDFTTQVPISRADFLATALASDFEVRHAE